MKMGIDLFPLPVGEGFPRLVGYPILPKDTQRGNRRQRGTKVMVKGSSSCDLSGCPTHDDLRM